MERSLLKLLRSTPPTLREDLASVLPSHAEEGVDGGRHPGGHDPANAIEPEVLRARLVGLFSSADPEVVRAVYHGLHTLPQEFAASIIAAVLLGVPRPGYLPSLSLNHESSSEEGHGSPGGGIAQSVEELAGALLHAPCNDERIRAARALGSLPQEAAIRALSKGVEHLEKHASAADEALAREVLAAFGNVVDGGGMQIAGRWLGQFEGALPRAAAEYVGQVGNEGMGLLVGLFGDKRRRIEANAQVAASALARWLPMETIAWCRQQLKTKAGRMNPTPVEVLHAWLRDEGSTLDASLPGWRTDAVAILEAFTRLNNPDICEAALNALVFHDPSVARRSALAVIDQSGSRCSISAAALRCLGSCGTEADIPLILDGLRSHNAGIVKASGQTLCRLLPGPDGWRTHLTRLLRSGASEVRSTAVELLGESGDAQDIQLVTERLADESPDVRGAALEALDRLAPRASKMHAVRMLGDNNDDVVACALAVLATRMRQATLIPHVLRRLPRARGGCGAVFLGWVANHAPDALPGAIEAAVRSRSDQTREAAAGLLGRHFGRDATEALWALAQDRAWQVRGEALEALRDILPERAREIADIWLSDPQLSEIPPKTCAVLERHDDWAVHQLIPLVRSSDPAIRHAALRKLAPIDDPRVMSEIFASVHDASEEVRTTAAALIDGGAESVPSLGRILGDASSADVVPQILTQIAERRRHLTSWARNIGTEVLGKTVIVHRYRQGIGRTGKVKDRPHEIHIEVTDSPLTSMHPHGVDIVRGIILHELGHHLYDVGVRGARALRGIAHSEGVDHIYDLLRDERLERAMRSRRPAWGVYFDRLASYAFAQSPVEVPLTEYAAFVAKSPDETRADISAGRLPGVLHGPAQRPTVETVAIRPYDLMAIPGAVPPFLAFMWCLRAGFDPRRHPDPTIARVMEEIPGNLRDLSHAEVLAVARQVAAHIGRREDVEHDLASRHAALDRARRLLGLLHRIVQDLADAGQLPETIAERLRGSPHIRCEPDDESQRSMALLPPRTIRGRTRPSRPAKWGIHLNLGADVQYSRLTEEKALPFDPVAHAALVKRIRPHVRVLRSYLERLGSREMAEYASRRGHRVDIVQARGVVVKPTAALLVYEHTVIAPDMYLGILIDRSGSMVGESIDLAKAFGALLAESARGIRGIEGHVNAFDDDTFYRLGGFRCNAIASLDAGGGNNDSGGLDRAAALALGSRRMRKVLVMISDGRPTECSIESLRALVSHLTSAGILCCQAAVAHMEAEAFPLFVDLSRYPFDEAVARFGRLLIQLTTGNVRHRHRTGGGPPAR